jgi:dUTP pyrophosphatase
LKNSQRNILGDESTLSGEEAINDRHGLELPLKEVKYEKYHGFWQPEIKFKLTRNAKLPTRATTFSAGLDLYSSEKTWIFPCTRKWVKTGIKVYLPHKTYGQIASRSGMAGTHSIDVAAGVIDEDYHGEIKVLLINNGNDLYEIKKHDRIAQLIVHRIYYAKPVDYDVDIDEPTINSKFSSRGENGFGSTGK